MARQTFKKVTTSPEKIAQINPKNQELINDYFDFATHLSPQSIINYQSNLNIFFCYVLDHCDNKFFPDLKNREIVKFGKFVKEVLQVGSSRQSQIRSCLSSFGDFFEKVYCDDYPQYVNRISKLITIDKEDPRREKTVLSQEQFDEVLNYLKTNRTPTEACLVALAAFSGARIAELVQFKTYSLSNDSLAFDGLFYETTHKIRTKGSGKSGKQITKFVIKQLFDPYLEEYLKYRQEIIDRTGVETDALFIQNNGKEVSKDTIYSWKKIWERDTHLNLYPHNFRHFWATYLSTLGISKDLIMYLTGWTSDMTGIYVDIDEKDRNWDKDLTKLKKGFGEE